MMDRKRVLEYLNSRRMGAPISQQDLQFMSDYIFATKNIRLHLRDVELLLHYRSIDIQQGLYAFIEELKRKYEVNALLDTRGNIVRYV